MKARLALAAAFVLALAVAGGASARIDAKPAPVESAPVLPTRVQDVNGKTVVIRNVSRIVPLNGDIAETIFTLGLTSRVVGVDTSALYPKQTVDEPPEDRLPADALRGGDPLAAADGGDRLDGGRPAAGTRAAPGSRRDRARDPGDRDPRRRRRGSCACSAGRSASPSGASGSRSRSKARSRPPSARRPRRRRGRGSRSSTSAARRCR